MSSYKHFTREERECLQEELEKGSGVNQIARLLGRSPSTISRELKRNYSKGKQRYHAWRAENLAIQRRRKNKRYGIVPGSKAWNYVVEKLNQYWSPEAICGRWHLENPEDKKLSVSTIYRYIRKKLLPNITAKTHLRRHGKRKNQNNTNHNTIHPDRIIPQWPDAIVSRSRIGDWEGDTIYGGIGKGAVVTLVDRKTRFLLAALLSSRNAQETRTVIERLLHNFPVQSISFDNGSEFAQFHLLEQHLHTLVYFAEPHKPWQRGSNENTNGILRFFFPKGFDFLSLSELQLQETVALINHRPRKCLGWKSPFEVFFSL